jgi:hypothetical protein
VVNGNRMLLLVSRSKSNGTSVGDFLCLDGSGYTNSIVAVAPHRKAQS